MTAQMRVAECGDYLVPVGGVPKYSGRDPATTRASEQPRHRIITDDIEPLADEWAYLGNDGTVSRI
jgi:hypothetical protein